VLSAQIAVLAAMKPGVSWLTCHKLAELEIIKALVAVGVLVTNVNNEGFENLYFCNQVLIMFKCSAFG